LLGLAVYNEKYSSCKALAELGADPNAFNNYDGRTPLMEAADLGYDDSDIDSRFLVMLLKHGGNPNTEQKYLDYSGSHGQTPLSIACAQGTLEYVKILINAGADINYKNDPSRGTLLYSAMLSGNPDLVLYLIQNGVDYRQPTWVLDNHKKLYITDNLRTWTFDLGSGKYKKKMEIVEFLKKHGVDYRKAAIPDFYYDSYDKNYLDKY
jgi:ankyrin repeat protein